MSKAQRGQGDGMFLIINNTGIVGSVIDTGLYLSLEIQGVRSVNSLTLVEAFAALQQQGYSLIWL